MLAQGFNLKKFIAIIDNMLHIILLFKRIRLGRSTGHEDKDSGL